jgi:hypothetical protein
MIDISTERGRATAHFTIEGTVDQVQARVRAIAERERRFRWHEAADGTLVLNTAANWATWGETMTIILGVAGMTRTSVSVRVEPKVRTTITDWGQGSRDIRLLHERLTAPDDPNHRHSQRDSRPVRH